MKTILFTMPCISLLFCNCATVTRGKTEEIQIQTVPSTAAITLSNGMTGTSPATFVVARKGDLEVTAKKSGYLTETKLLPSSVSKKGGAAMAGNILLGGVVGAAIDAGSGAAYSHQPNPLIIKLHEN